MRHNTIVQENIPLAPLTTLRIGGTASFFREADSENAVIEALAFAETRNLPVLILGGGSNLIIADTGFPGVVIRMALRGIVVSAQGNLIQVTAGAGQDWDSFTRYAVEQGWAGVECLAGIPGTVGATPVQNVGAYGQEVADTIVFVRAYDRRERRIVELSAAECGFAYRHSRFNSSEPDRWVILSVTYALRPGGAASLKYADLIRYFGENPSPTLAEVYTVVRVIRARKGMVLDPADPDTRSVGSFFKNPTVSVEKFAALAAATPAMPHYLQTDGSVKIPAAYLIEQAGFYRGQTFGAIALSSKHILALTNRGGATAAEVLDAARKIREGVFQKWGIGLTMEPLLAPALKHSPKI